MTIKFTLDPGHYTNYNTGVVKGYYEGNEMFKLAGYLKTALEQYNGFTVVLTKETLASNPDLEIRGRFAINNNSDVFISLHSNAAGAYATGVVLFNSLKRPNSVTLANALGHSVAQLMGTNYRGCLTRLYPGTQNTDYYGVLRAAVRSGNVPYVYIIEHGFHTNEKECTWLYNDAHLKQLAETEAAVFAGYFHATKKNTTVISDTNAPFLVAPSKSYTFKITADSRPNFTAGSPLTFTVEFVKQENRDYFFKVTAIGKSGQGCGFYINGAKTPVAVATITK